MARVRLKNLTKHFGDVVAVDDVTLDIADREFLTLLGPSGCGKTTLLNMIAGLESPTAGEVWFDDRNVTAVPPERRDIAMVFQTYALYPHMSVFDNVAFGLKMRGVPAEDRNDSCWKRQRPWRSNTCWTASPVRSAAGSGSGSPWPAPSSAIRACSSSTNRCPTWTRSFAW